ncbi:MAG: hypothetical protein V4664_01795 [Patescibacteria group bacterium]
MQTGLSYFRKNLKNLPLDVREAIVNTEYLEGLEEIQNSEKLHIDQAASMEELTFRLMLGEIDTEDYSIEIGKALNIDSLKTAQIVRAVDEKIMQPIKMELKKIQDENAPIEDVELPPEDHNNLDAGDILAEVENPTPSVGIEHDVLLPRTQEPKIPDGWPVNTTEVIPPKEQSPVSQTAPTLNQKINEVTVTKPTEITHSIDPYKEPVE